MLSERNRGTLAEIERDLCASDPGLAHWFGGLDGRGTRRSERVLLITVRQYLLALLGPLLMVIVSALAVTPVLVLYGVSSP